MKNEYNWVLLRASDEHIWVSADVFIFLETGEWVYGNRA